MNDLVFFSASHTADLIRSREVSVREVVEAYLEQIRRHNPTLNAVVTLDEEGALGRAKEADAAIARGEFWGPLHGVPVTLKDVHDTAGMRTTFGTASLETLGKRLPTEDSTVATRLRNAGAILLGKTNADLFPDNPFGETRSPWDINRTPGTSSSGAAAALAAGMTALDVGSDLGGSITVPAHFSGLYGLRPTEQRIPFRFATDPVLLWHVVLVVGPMARSVEDLRLALQVLAGSDGYNPMIPPVPLQQAAPRRLQDLRVAWVSQFADSPTSPAIRKAIEDFAAQLQQLGVRVEEVTPTVDLHEQVQIGRRLIDIVVDAFTPKPSLLKDYLTVLEERNPFITAWDRFFDQWDVFLCPPEFRTAPLLADNEKLLLDEQELSIDDLITASMLFPATGHPTVVIPLSNHPPGIPIGVQLVGRRWMDGELLSVAELLSEVAGGFERPPGY